MPRPKHRHQGKPQHLPHCKYYKGEPSGNAAIFDVRSQQEDAEAEARRSRLQLQRLPALTIRRQLQVQWGPTVSLPQPGEGPLPGPPPGHNVRLFEVRHGETQAAASAAPTFGKTFVVQKQGEAGSHRPPLTQPLKPVDVSPLRQLPPEQPPAEIQPQLPPPVLPSPPPRPPSPPHSSSPVRQQTSGARPASRGRPSRNAASRTAITSTSARHSHTCGSRGAARSRVAPSSTPAGRSRAAAPSPPRRSQAAAPSPPRRSSTRGISARRPSPGAGASTAAARGPALVPSASLPAHDAAPTAGLPRRAPARVDITSTSLPSTVPGGVVPGAHPDVLFRELSATAEARRIASVPTAVVADSASGPPSAERGASLYGEMSAADLAGLGLAGRADAVLDGDGNGEGDADLWRAAQRIRRQQEVTDIEQRVLDLIGARVVAGLLNRNGKLQFENWGEYRMQQSSLSDEVGEHRVLGEGISMEETEIRTPINYDDYLDQEPADNEPEYNGNEKGGSAGSGSPNYEDDFEEEEDEEEEANHQETPPVFGDTRQKQPKDQKLTSIPEIQVDSESLKDEKSGNGSAEVEATPPSPEPAAPSPVLAPSSPPRTPPSPGRIGTVRIRSRRTGGVTTISLPLLPHIPTPTPTPVSSPECSRTGAICRVVTPERSPSPRSGEGSRVATPPPSPEHTRERVTLFKWRSRIEAPPAPALTPPDSPPPAPLGAFSFTLEGASPSSSPPIHTSTSAGAGAQDAPAEEPLRTGTGWQTSGEMRAVAETPAMPRGYGRAPGLSLTSSSSLTYSSSLSSNPQVQSQDSLSWGEVRPPREASSSADTHLSQGEVPPGRARESAWLCSSLSEGELVSRHRCSKGASSHRQAKAETDRSLVTSIAGAAAGIEKGGTRKDLSEGEVSEGLVPVLPYDVPDDMDSTSVSDTS